MTSVVEMKTLNVSPEQETINILGDSLDKINETLADGQQVYEFMQKQTPNVQEDKNKKSHEEDLKKFKDRIDNLEKVKKEIKSEILKYEKKIAAKSKKGGRRTRKKRGKRTRRRKRKRKKRRTRRAGMLTSKKPGQRGLTKREIDLRKKKSLKRLEKFKKELEARTTSLPNKLNFFEKLSISPVQTNAETMQSFQERMSPVNFTKTTSIGGKKTRKKRRRKRRR